MQKCVTCSRPMSPASRLNNTGRSFFFFSLSQIEQKYEQRNSDDNFAFRQAAGNISIIPSPLRSTSQFPNVHSGRLEQVGQQDPAFGWEMHDRGQSARDGHDTWWQERIGEPFGDEARHWQISHGFMGLGSNSSPIR